MIAVIVPAHDEAAVIGRCLASIALAGADPRLRDEPVMVVVALDACSDETAAVCADHGATTVRVDVRCVGAARAAAGSHALAQGARWIASTDADTAVPADWLWRQVHCGADAFCGAVEVTDWLDYPDLVRNAFTEREAVRDGHRHIHGANLGMSAAAYMAAGGFAALATGEDVALVDALACSGASIAWLARPTVATSARRTARAPHGFSSFLRALEREVLDVGAFIAATARGAGMMEQPADLLGWAATVVLIATLVRQIYKQHQAGSTEGVSTWLFVGQITASVLFTVYSALVGSVVFVVTNSLILLTAVVGQVLAIRRRRAGS